MFGAAARYKLVCEYVGPRFHGWQKQTNVGALRGGGEGSLPTVSGALEHALQKSNAGRLLGNLVGCGRTDHGVHAIAQTAHFDFESKRGNVIEGDVMRELINAWLPHGARNAVAVLQCEATHADFHARFDCKSRKYVYRITASDRAGASRLFDTQTSWFLPLRLDVDRMRAAAALLNGEHDLAALRASGCAAKTTVRDLRLEVAEVAAAGGGGGGGSIGDVRQLASLPLARGDGTQHIVISAEQPSFLYKQVRMMVHVIVDIGAGRRPLDDIHRLLELKKPSFAVGVAPPHGLYFVAAKY